MLFRSCRPDRVIIEGNNATIIDYKTGKPSDEHHKQLHYYGEVLENMGYGQIKKFLIYTADKLLVEVH